MVDARLCGVSAVKLPVTSLAASRAWYDRVFGFEIAFEFRDDDGVVRGLSGHLDGVPNTYLALREDPETAQALSGWNLVNWAVADRGQVDAWAVRLDGLGVAHSPPIDATVGWMLVLHDPDGHELHLYARQRHGIVQTGRRGYGSAAPPPSTAAR